MAPPSSAAAPPATPPRSARPARHAANWATPAARLLLPADSARADWLAARRLGIGGSDTPALLNESPHQSLYGLWLDKTGHTDHTGDTDATRRGTWLEPHLARWVTTTTGIAVRRCGLLVSRARDHLRTTPDRLTADGGVLEIKTVGQFAAAAAEWRHGIARHAYLQAQQQLAVTGRSHAWFVWYQDPTPQLRGPVDRDPDLIDEITARADWFWADHVTTAVPPPVDLATVTDEELALRWPTAVPGTAAEAAYPAHVRALLDERARLKTDAKHLDQRLGDIDRALKAFTGDAETLLVDGRPVLTHRTVTARRFDEKAFRAAFPATARRFTRPHTYRRLHIPTSRKKTR